MSAGSTNCKVLLPSLGVLNMGQMLTPGRPNCIPLANNCEIRGFVSARDKADDALV